jgi:FlaA1/EpsC-like NDP-sugar epimerase
MSDSMPDCQGKTLLITGATGSFGNAVFQRFLSSDIPLIRILSRDGNTKRHAVSVP